jgi:hypothetical protein
MKKITFLVAVLMLIGSMAFSQKNSFKLKQGGVIHQVSSLPQSELATACDTLLPPTATLPCGDSLVYYMLQSNAGYFTGNDKYGDEAIAQKYNNTVNGTISKVLVAEAAVKAATGTTTTSVKLYSINATTKAPSTLLGTSNAVAMSAISASGLTAYTFTTPVAITGAFAASVVFPTTAGDTLAVYSNPQDCHTTDSLSWTMESDGNWYAYSNGYSNWGANIELAIYPVLCPGTGINEYFTNGIKLEQNQPNPASTTTLIQYEVQYNSNVSLQVFDITGRLVLNIEEGNQNSGLHSVLIDAGKLQSGAYFYTLKAGENRLTKKMIVE